MTAVLPAAASTTAPGLDLDRVRRDVEAVPDPELPVLTLGQLGVVRDVRAADPLAQPAGDPGAGPAARGAERPVVVVDITPTYSGCPAMEVIARDVAAAVEAAGCVPDVRIVLSPAWTTDWITPEGRQSLAEAGIAPPGRVAGGPVQISLGRRPAPPACPRCGSSEVEELARFGSTACKSLWRCRSCREPFDHLKPL